MRWMVPLAMALTVVAAPRAGAEPAPLVVAMDKVRILKLKTDAQQVILANPGIVDVTVENPRLLVLFGRAIGETSLTVLDGDGNAALEHAIVVTPGEPRRVTVHVPQRGGAGTVSTNYSCVQRCTPVVPVSGGGSGTGFSPQVPATPPGGGGGGGGGEAPVREEPPAPESGGGTANP